MKPRNDCTNRSFSCRLAVLRTCVLDNGTSLLIHSFLNMFIKTNILRIDHPRKTIIFGISRSHNKVSTKYEK